MIQLSRKQEDEHIDHKHPYKQCSKLFYYIGGMASNWDDLDKLRSRVDWSVEKASFEYQSSQIREEINRKKSQSEMEQQFVILVGTEAAKFIKCIPRDGEDNGNRTKSKQQQTYGTKP